MQHESPYDILRLVRSVSVWGYLAGIPLDLSNLLGKAFPRGDRMTLVQVLAIWFLVSVASAPFLGSFLHKRRTKRDFQGHLDTEARRVRLEKLVDLADEFDAAETTPERQAIYRKATRLGFTSDSDRDWQGAAFSLDEDLHPHPKDAA